jgi:hypothetical protein
MHGKNNLGGRLIVKAIFENNDPAKTIFLKID